MKAKLFLFSLIFGIWTGSVQAQNRVFAAITGHGFEDTYNFGFGLRVGRLVAVLDRPVIFIGAVGVFHQGQTRNETYISDAAGRPINVELTENVAYAGAELGLNVRLALVTLRPSVMYALARVNKDVPQFSIEGTFTGRGEADRTEGFFSPSLGLAIPFGNMSIGGDLRYLDVPDAATWAIYSVLAFRF